MPATKGNKWWMLRYKHGVDKKFTPETLLAASLEYFSITDERKWKKKDWVGKDAFEVERETDTPYTISGLCLYLGITNQTWLNYGSNEGTYKDFFDVYTCVSQIIYTQKVEGAMVGAFNASIVAMELGLKSKSEIDVTDNRKDVMKVFEAVEAMALKTEE